MKVETGETLVKPPIKLKPLEKVKHSEEIF
jgi:hypothetical protein